MNCNQKIRSKLLAIIDSELFFTELNKIYIENLTDIKNIGSELAAIHNDNSVDIIAKFLTVKDSEDQSFTYAMLEIFNNILPTIISPVSDVVRSITYINLELKVNARSCNSGLELYCDKKEGRENQILSYALLNPNDSIDFISAALISGSKSNLDIFVNKAIELICNDNKHIQNNALFALGRINYSNNTDLTDKVLNEIEKILKFGHSDLLYSTAVETLMNIYLNTKFGDSELARLLRLALSQPSKETLLLASRYFNFNTNNIPDSAIHVFLNAFSEISPSNVDVLRQIDYGLSHLLEANKEELLISFLEKILIKSKGAISIAIFSSLLNKIKNNNEFLNTLVTRWFLSKKTVLGKAINEIVGQNYDKNIELSINADLLSSENEGICLFLAKKACGWLFMSPISAVSFMLSLIDFASKSEVESINEIILNPLLLSYSGSVNEYLSNKLENGTISEKESASTILESIKTYHKGLEKAWDIKELQPSLTQREAYQRKYNEDSNKAYKESSKNSFLSSFFGKPQVMLYGNTSIYTMHGMNNSRHRQEAPLAQLKTSFEFPSLQVLDPHGIDNKLWSFKTEGCTE